MKKSAITVNVDLSQRSSVLTVAMLLLFVSMQTHPSALPLTSFEYKQSFETEDTSAVWATNGTSIIHSKGLSPEQSMSGERSLKIDVTFETATYLYYAIPLPKPIPNIGVLRFNAALRGETSTPDAKVALGLSTSFAPAPRGGERLDLDFAGPGPSWISGELIDVVSAARAKAKKWADANAAQAGPDDFGNWTTKIVLYFTGPIGSRFTVYLDDLVLAGQIPDSNYYSEQTNAAWSAYLLRIGDEVSAMVDEVTGFSVEITNPPDIELVAQLKARALEIESAVDSRGFPSSAEFDELSQSLGALEGIAGRQGRADGDIITYSREPTSSPPILPKQTMTLAPSSVLKVRACPGEFEPVSLILYATKDVDNVSVTIGDFIGPNGARIQSTQADVRVVKPWYQAGRNDVIQRAERILVPELLLKDDSLVQVDLENKRNRLRVDFPNGAQYIDVSLSDGVFPDNGVFDDSPSLLPFDLKRYENKELWITVRVPADATAGQYLAILTLEGRELAPMELSVQLEVLPFALRPPLITYGIYYRGGFYATPPNGVEANNKTPKQYRAELENIRDHGVGYPTLYFGGMDRVPEMLEIRREVGLPTDRLFSMQGTSGISADTVARWRALAIDRGFTGDVYFYARDEATASELVAQVADWKTTRAAGGLVFGAVYGDALELVGEHLDLPILNGRDRSEAQVEGWHSLGKPLYTYHKPQVGVEDPLLYRATFGIRLWADGYDGVLNYAYQHAAGHIWNDWDHTAYRDHVFAYPTTNGLVDTVQWEGFREAIDDVRYLSTLLELAREIGQPTFSEVAEWVRQLSEDKEPATLRALIIDQIHQIQGRNAIPTVKGLRAVGR